MSTVAMAQVTGHRPAVSSIHISNPQSPAEAAANEQATEMRLNNGSRCVTVTQDGICIGGGVAFGVAAIYLGVTGTWIPLAIGAGITSGAFWSLFIIDKTCGRSSQMKEVISNALAKIAQQQGLQRTIISQESRAVDEAAELNKIMTPNLDAAIAINKAGNADTSELRKTVDQLQTELGELKISYQNLQSQLATTIEENDQLKEQLAQFAKMLEQFQAQVAQASAAIPALQQVDLKWDASVQKFSESSNKLTAGFKQVLDQFQSHAAINETLVKEKEALETQLEQLSSILKASEATKMEMGEENNQLRMTNQRLAEMNATFKALSRELEIDKGDLESRKKLFEEEQSSWAQKLAQMNSVTQQLGDAVNATNSPDIEEYLRSNQAYVALQMERLKKEENGND